MGAIFEFTGHPALFPARKKGSPGTTDTKFGGPQRVDSYFQGHLRSSVPSLGTSFPFFIYFHFSDRMETLCSLTLCPTITALFSED